ncbi:MAG: PQQ-dependent sugar dehydrogenase [Thermomicrobiales bacterium]|nr:PQQ-dependent sugar dehydrogenase [Thermomicrobiales bacterium]
MNTFPLSLTRRMAIKLSAIAGLAGLTPVSARLSAQQAGQFSLSLLVEGLDKPVFMVDPNDGSGRFLVVDQTGQILIWRDGAIEPTPWLDLSDRVSGGSEQGLLGLALHPSFAENGRLFVHYTDVNGNTLVERYEQASDNPDQVDTSTAFRVLSVEQPASNHNGGMMAFGPDGYLYIGLGDGGSQGDPSGNGQNLGVLLGKILRLDMDSDPGEGGYLIPTDNPFTAVFSARGEIWATGLRNPWRFSFDRATGDLWIADVGQNSYEEINVQPAGIGGQNYGWSLAEGFSCYNDPQCESNSNLTWPVFAYGRDVGISVTGGYVYRGAGIPSLDGVYFFGDYGTGYIWLLASNGDGTYSASEPVPTELNISSFAEDANGELYVIDLNGSIYRIAGV